MCNSGVVSRAKIKKMKKKEGCQANSLKNKPSLTLHNDYLTTYLANSVSCKEKGGYAIIGLPPSNSTNNIPSDLYI